MALAVRLRPIISFLLISLISCNALLSATGGVFLSFHHDFSFHLDAGVAGVEDAKTDAKLPTTVAEVSESSHHHDHHHHELKLTADMDPTIRGNTFDRVQAPVLLLVAAMDRFDSLLVQPVRPMSSGSAIRPPPEVMPNHLSVLRTQVLRL